jgi:hypothetical protein
MMQPSFNTRLMSFLNKVFVGGQVQYSGLGRLFFSASEAVRSHLARATLIML